MLLFEGNNLFSNLAECAFNEILLVREKWSNMAKDY
jgi:hypothetical protein